MKKLAEVDEAKTIMTGAIDWSVMRWLKEKKSVRKAADKANHALWDLQKEVKTHWPEELKAAYGDLENGEARHHETDPHFKVLAKRVRDADDTAYRAHLDAEETFAKAEKILSTSMAREGCRKAILSWELYEDAITKAELGIRAAKANK